MTDGRKKTTDAGPWVYYKLTYEPLAQVSLKDMIAIENASKELLDYYHV